MGTTILPRPKIDAILAEIPRHGPTYSCFVLSKAGRIGELETEDDMANIFFLYGDVRIEVDRESLTGAEIKAAIKVKVLTLDLTHDLVLEGRGHDADRVIADDDSVNLAHGHGEGPKKFFTRPPTNFGAP